VEADDGEVVSYSPLVGVGEHLSLELGVGAQAEALVREGDQVEVEVEVVEEIGTDAGHEYDLSPLSRSSFPPYYIRQ